VLSSKVELKSRANVKTRVERKDCFFNTNWIVMKERAWERKRASAELSLEN